MNDNFFPKNLVFLRKQNNLTQGELGARINVDQTTIGRWEDGNREPTMGNLISLANIFNIPLQELTSKDIQNVQHNEFDNILFSKAKDLSDEDKQVVINVIDSITKKVKQEQNNE